MNDRRYFYFPIGLPFFLILVFLFLLIYPLFILLFAGGIVEAFQRLGFNAVSGTLVFLLALVGSAINIPIKKINSETPLVEEKVVYFCGVPCVIPSTREQSTILSINVGGALIPVLISIYEFIRLFALGAGGTALSSLVGIAIVAIVVHFFAKPVKGVGIAVPFFVPPIVTVIVALLITRQYHPAVAYISGTIGTLIGADLLNLKKIPDLGAPVVSIGGAGTFDGVFITGILSVLLI
ncbi:MAG: DUF1614 domain-containing protein [Candidatus Atribacteria bacterium]|nr:DUF1614 domain-containing protein [Candidatus Atribacteria bacterium]